MAMELVLLAESRSPMSVSSNGEKGVAGYTVSGKTLLSLGLAWGLEANSALSLTLCMRSRKD